MKEIKVIELERPKVNVKDFSKMIGLIFGALLMVAGGIMLPTIILTLPGIGLFFIGLMVVRAFAPKITFDCPACGLEATANHRVKNTKCPSCEFVIPVRWVKQKPTKIKKETR